MQLVKIILTLRKTAFVLSAVLALLGILTTQPHAKGTNQTSLVPLYSRIFDLQADLSKFGYDESTIPIDRVKWIEEAIENEQLFEGGVIAIRSKKQPIRLTWPAISPEGGPYRLQKVTNFEGISPDYFDDLHEVYEKKQGSPGFMYFSKERPFEYYANCGNWQSGDDLKRGTGPLRCSIIVSYPEDETIYLIARLYTPRHPSEFPAIAKRLYEFVRCLDVTEQVKNDPDYFRDPDDVNYRKTKNCRQEVS